MMTTQTITGELLSVSVSNLSTKSTPKPWHTMVCREMTHPIEYKYKVRIIIDKYGRTKTLTTDGTSKAGEWLYRLSDMYPLDIPEKVTITTTDGKTIDTIEVAKCTQQK